MMLLICSSTSTFVWGMNIGQPHSKKRSNLSFDEPRHWKTKYIRRGLFICILDLHIILGFYELFLSYYGEREKFIHVVRCIPFMLTFERNLHVTRCIPLTLTFERNLHITRCIPFSLTFSLFILISLGLFMIY